MTTKKNPLLISLFITLLLSIFIVILPIEIIDAVTYKLWEDRYNFLSTTTKWTKWCEAAYHSKPNKFIREPMNARSDYAYILFGLWLTVVSMFDFYEKYCKKRNNIHLNEYANHIVYDLCDRVEKSDGDDDVKDDEVDDEEDDGQQGKKEQMRENNIQIEQEYEITNTRESLTEEKDQTSSSVIAEIIEEEIPSAIIQYPQITFIFGLVNIAHGYGSFFNHACQCGPGGTADVAGMLAVMIIPSLYFPLQFVMGLKNPSKWLIQCFVLIPTLGLVLLLVGFLTQQSMRSFRNSDVTFVSMDFVLGTILILYETCWRNQQTTGRSHKFKYFYLILIVGTFVIGYLAWYLDKEKIWCSQKPELHLLQLGHVVWHLLTCGTLISTYLFFRSEVIIDRRREDTDTDV